MQHSTQKKDDQESACASSHADTYFLEMKYWTLHIHLAVSLDILPLEHKEIRELTLICRTRFFSKTSFCLSPVKVLLEDILKSDFHTLWNQMPFSEAIFFFLNVYSKQESTLNLLKSKLLYPNMESQMLPFFSPWLSMH